MDSCDTTIYRQEFYPGGMIACLYNYDTPEAGAAAFYNQVKLAQFIIPGLLPVGQYVVPITWGDLRGVAAKLKSGTTSFLGIRSNGFLQPFVLSSVVEIVGGLLAAKSTWQLGDVSYMWNWTVLPSFITDDGARIDAAGDAFSKGWMDANQAAHELYGKEIKLEAQEVWPFTLAFLSLSYSVSNFGAVYDLDGTTVVDGHNWLEVDRHPMVTDGSCVSSEVLQSRMNLSRDRCVPTFGSTQEFLVKAIVELAGTPLLAAMKTGDVAKIAEAALSMGLYSSAKLTQQDWNSLKSALVVLSEKIAKRAGQTIGLQDSGYVPPGLVATATGTTAATGTTKPTTGTSSTAPEKKAGTTVEESSSGWLWGGLAVAAVAAGGWYYKTRVMDRKPSW
jgi:hypothetical protein